MFYLFGAIIYIIQLALICFTFIATIKYIKSFRRGGVRFSDVTINKIDKIRSDGAYSAVINNDYTCNFMARGYTGEFFETLEPTTKLRLYWYKPIFGNLEVGNIMLADNRKLNMKGHGSGFFMSFIGRFLAYYIILVVTAGMTLDALEFIWRIVLVGITPSGDALGEIGMRFLWISLITAFLHSRKRSNRVLSYINATGLEGNILEHSTKIRGKFS